MSRLVFEEGLLKATGYTGRGRLLQHLKKHGVPYFEGKGGRVYTTIDALNSVLIPNTKNSEPIEFE